MDSGLTATVKILASNREGSNLLIYEYLERGSLGELLHGYSCNLEWPTRFHVVVESLPENYVLPPERRLGEVKFSPGKSNNIPVLDLGGHDRNEIIQQITKASQGFGFFQVINHGVSKELMDETRNVVKEFHAMSAKEKFLECLKDPQ
ncbi:hypothetical protein Q3G72_034252 [Acer saccharum]|nr:hypothetical protein Q3G72_034252 [Acer saccharum]